MPFKKTLIIGLGLIGGSFAKAIRKAKISKEIFAVDLELEEIELAKNDGVIDGGFDELTFLEDEISTFDLIVIATPLSAYEEIFFALKNVDVLVMDLGSIKNFNFKNKPKNFVPCHPIAGSENNGFEHASADLFSGRKFVICAQNSAAKKVEEIVRKIGAIPEFIEAKKHDEIFALVSHLPQFLSFLTKEFSPKNIENEFFKKAFRLDNSSPEVWKDIFSMNEKNLEKFYLEFFENLEKNINSPLTNINPPLTPALSHKEIGSKDGLNSTPPLLVGEGWGEGNKFLEENFAAIFFRTLVVKSFLEIQKIKTFQTYAGQGFRDFTSIISVLNFDEKNLQNLIKKNQQKIQKFFDLIS